jgi:hypothetical protein
MSNESGHMKGYGKEATLGRMFCHPDIRMRFVKHRDFMAVVRVINPELCERAFERRPCERTLRYIGYAEFDEPARSQEPDSEGFVPGGLYHSIDFNGATYTVKETRTIMGMAYFEAVGDN